MHLGWTWAFKSSRFVITIIYCFVEKKKILLAKNSENLVSAHLEYAPTLKVQKFNKRLIE